MTVNELRDFIFERTVFVKESNYYSIKRLERKYLLLIATKLIEKIAGPRNAKEHSEKQSKIITQ